MDGAYQPTTERTNSISEDATCSLGSIWPRSRRRENVEIEIEVEGDHDLAHTKSSSKTKKAGYR